MRNVPIAAAKMKFCELVRCVNKTGQKVVITKNGSPMAVLISHEEFDGWHETQSITADAGFMEEIRAGLAGLQKTKKHYTLEELFDRP
jgi:prevent-host-death family protein